MARRVHPKLSSQDGMSALINKTFNPQPKLHQGYISQLEGLTSLEEQALGIKQFPENNAWWLMLVLGCPFREAKLLTWLITDDRNVPPELILRYRQHGEVLPDELTFKPNESPEILFYELINRLREMFVEHEYKNNLKPVVKDNIFWRYNVDEVSMLTWSRSLSVEWERFMLSKECFPGQRMLISKYPSAFIRPALMDVFRDHKQAFRWYFLRSLLEPEKKSANQEGLDKEEIRTARMRFFLFNLYNYGERWITSIPSLKRYVSDSFNHSFIPNVWERRRQLLTVIRLLDQYQYFQIGLMANEPEAELVIKSNRWIIQQTVTRLPLYLPEEDEASLICGPTHIFWSQPNAVLPVYLEFEKEWQSFSKVIETIESMCENSSFKYCGNPFLQPQQNARQCFFLRK